MVRHLILIIVCSSLTNLHAQNDSVFCKQLSALQDLIDTVHYSPKPVDDSLSRGVHDLFMKSLDENKRFLRHTDIEAFEMDKFQIDDYLRTNSCDFVGKYKDTLRQRILWTKGIIASLSNQPLDYSGKDTLYFTPNNEHPYFKNEAHAERYWNKRIRFLIVSKLIEEDSLVDNIKSNFLVREAEIKQKVIDNQLCLLNESLHTNGNFETYVEELFLNALLNYEDPNSSFFNDSDKKEFENHLSNNKLSFGINTDKTNEGEIVIVYISPGGAAFKNGQFDEGDIVLSLKSGNDLLETYCISNDDILTFINDPKHHTIDFKIKKTDASIQNILLTKSVSKVEDNTIRGFIVEAKEDFGYIKIPSFYTDMESSRGFGVASDVAKELYKLSKENIKGLVIDLRFNGGGSMKEAAELSGMFIDKGPLSIIKYANGETFTIRDMYRGAIFNKPIVVLINNYSASASELFASVMQDYSRAVIVGSPSHGKSSAQVILPLSETEDLGYSKITVEKFYRITGLSHQSMGVIPDVVLPSLYDNFKTNEGFERFALSIDSVEAKMKFHPFKPIPLNILANSSQKRSEIHPSFRAIKNINNIVLNDYINKTSEYPLTLDNIYNDITGYNNLWNDFYSELESEVTTLNVRNTVLTEKDLQQNPNENELIEQEIEEIVKDIYIEEACTILSDLLSSKSN